MFKPTKIISWNVNGIVPTIEGGFVRALRGFEPEIICFQETRTDQEPTVLPEFNHYWFSGERPGYAGVAILSKNEPISVKYGFGDPDLDCEARLLTLEFENVWVVNAYFPRSEGNLARHLFRMRWDDALFDFLHELDGTKPVILCGDFNITRSPIDIYPENTRMMAAEGGYISEEREALEALLESGFTDVFRHRYPDEEGAYTWWSNRKHKREENRGWRLDYFVVSNRLLLRVFNMYHLKNLEGSDHCPIMLTINLSGSTK